MIERLGVVDQSPIASGSNAVEALQNSIDLAQRCEALGYHRYWVAEHHSSQALAGSAPEILIGRLAAATQSMRIGSGGVMLTHYSAYKVAEQFRMLHALFPGRIDLGLGRAPGSDQTTAAALAKGPGALSAQHYPAQVAELAEYLADSPNPAGAFRDVRATPWTPDAPPLWLLASSEGSAGIAAHLGMPLVWAEFIAQGDGSAIVQAYRDHYQPSEAYPEPIVMLATAAIAADTTQEAALAASSVQRWRAGGLQGQIPEPSAPGVEPPKVRPLLQINDRSNRPLLNGTADHVRSSLEAMAERYGATEVLLITITHDHRSRVRSYELLADEFGLTSTAVEGSPQTSTVTAG